jgi:hypothetical protein
MLSVCFLFHAYCSLMVYCIIVQCDMFSLFLVVHHIHLSDNAQEAGVWRIYWHGRCLARDEVEDRQTVAISPPNTGFLGIITFIQRVTNIFK